MTDLLNLVPAVAMARAVRNDIETFVQEDVNATLASGSSPATTTDDGGGSTQVEISGGAKRALGFVAIALILSLVVFVLNIVGIVYEFRCKYTLLGVISILGLFFGLPIGMIFYIVYLVNPSICQA